MIRSIVGDLINKHQGFPRARIVDLGDHSVVFETTTAIEDYRAKELGGEADLVSEYVHRLDDGHTVWDVGANIGLFSLFGAETGAHVHAFEPDPAFAERLRRNIYLNGLGDRITPHETALNDCEGDVTLFSDGVAGNSPGLRNHSDEQRNEITVDQQRGAGLDLPAPDVLKIDVEGAEGGVLRGLIDILDRIGIIVLEIHPTMLQQFGDTTGEVRQIVECRGFSVAYEQRRNEQVQLVYSRE